MAAVGLLAWIAVCKYLDHLPLYRIEQIAARDGVPLARSTLGEWIGRIGVALQPLADVLLTSLRERRRYKPSEIAKCYERRWGIETSYRELKQTMLGSALTLRSKTVDGVYQEIWGNLIAYDLIRLEIAKAALTVKCEPTEVPVGRAKSPTPGRVKIPHLLTI